MDNTYVKMVIMIIKKIVYVNNAQRFGKFITEKLIYKNKLTLKFK